MSPARPPGRARRRRYTSKPACVVVASAGMQPAALEKRGCGPRPAARLAAREKRDCGSRPTLQSAALEKRHCGGSSSAKDGRSTGGPRTDPSCGGGGTTGERRPSWVQRRRRPANRGLRRRDWHAAAGTGAEATRATDGGEASGGWSSVQAVSCLGTGAMAGAVAELLQDALRSRAASCWARGEHASERRGIGAAGGEH